jgi:UDP-N-acetylmuramoyl-tripeptide--D-alanyl-D-alanine ligase
MHYDKIYKLFKQHPFIQTDTRLLKKGEIFFALKGPNFNGNLFASKAIELGAAAVIVDEETGIEDPRIILVDDTLTALQELALYHRKKFNIPFIAITGSNGKTTTKELVHAVLSTKFKTYTTKGNLNNHIGIPLTILSIKDDAEMAVIEMGANHQKEIEGYCKIALPTHGIINNCGKAHMEGFGGVEGVRKGKGELFDFLSNENGTAFVNSDLNYLVQMSEKINQVIFYGNEKGKHKIRAIEKEPFLKLELKDPELGTQFFETNLVGEYNCPNIDAAITVGLHFGISIEKIKDAIASYHPDNARSQLIQKGTNKIILDAYNANPTSMKLAIENIASMKAEKKILFLGGMMELGDYSIKEHSEIIDLLLKLNLQNVVLVGGDFEKTSHPFTFFKTAAEAENWLKGKLPVNSLILIKGSRSIKMEKILDYF